MASSISRLPEEHVARRYPLDGPIVQAQTQCAVGIEALGDARDGAIWQPRLTALADAGGPL